MTKFTLDLYLDGYETEEEMIEACKEFIYSQLNFTASSVSNIKHIPEDTDKELTWELYAIHVPGKKSWWVQGHLKKMPCIPYLWKSKQSAEKYMKDLDYFYGWTNKGFPPEITTVVTSTDLYNVP